MRISDIPNEVWTHIMSFVEDKTYLSMTCKKFVDITNRMDESVINLNNPYYLKKNFTKKYRDVFLCISRITNHKSLNFMAYTIDKYNMDKMYMYLILNQNCVTNNISKSEYTYKFIKTLLHAHDSKNIFKMCLTNIFANQSYDILMIFLNYSDIKAQCPRIFLEYYYYGPLTSTFLGHYYGEKIDIVIRDIEYLVSINAMTYGELFNAYNSLDTDFKPSINLHYQLGNYLGRKQSYCIIF